MGGVHLGRVLSREHSIAEEDVEMHGGHSWSVFLFRYHHRGSFGASKALGIMIPFCFCFRK